jgi:hypothetical protein
VARLTGTKHSILWECDRSKRAFRRQWSSAWPAACARIPRNAFRPCQKPRLQQSIASFETTLRLSPFFTLATGFLAAAHVRYGNLSAAKKLMEGVMERRSKQYVSPACFGIYHAALGHADSMFEFLQAALSERDPYLTRMDAEPYFDPFRPDPRYRDISNRA